jgi:hypothetical protein
MGFAKLIVLARIEQDALCRCRFTGIDMGHYSNISCQMKVGHKLMFLGGY